MSATGLLHRFFLQSKAWRWLDWTEFTYYMPDCAIVILICHIVYTRFRDDNGIQGSSTALQDVDSKGLIWRSCVLKHIFCHLVVRITLIGECTSNYKVKEKSMTLIPYSQYKNWVFCLFLFYSQLTSYLNTTTPHIGLIYEYDQDNSRDVLWQN